MTKKTVTLLSVAILLFGLLIGSIAGCGEEEEAPKKEEAAPKEVIKEVTKEKAMTLAEVAKAIEAGKIDVGTGYGLALEERYHQIHATVLGLDCATCHIMATPTTTEMVFAAQDVSPAAPGPVDKRACLGCHRAGGPGDPVYGSDAP